MNAAPAVPPLAPPPPAAPIDPVALRTQLGDVAGAVSCAVPKFAVSPEGEVRVSGVVGGGTPDGALQSVVKATAPAPARVVWNAQTVPTAYCGMLDLVRPLLSASDNGLGLRLQGDATVLRDKDLIRPEVRPDFPAYVQVDYLSSDTSVAHLFPSRTSPDRMAEPGTWVSLDDLAKSRWEAGTPFGTDMIVAVASSVPLFTPRRLTADDTVQTYVPALQAAIEAARRKNGRVVAQIFVLKTVPK